MVADDSGGAPPTPPARIVDANTFVDGLTVADPYFAINYSLDGDYAKFALTPTATHGWSGYCFGGAYRSNCLYSYDPGNGNTVRGPATTTTPG